MFTFIRAKIQIFIVNQATREVFERVGRHQGYDKVSLIINNELLGHQEQ
jgi:hypothetical protein